MFKHRVSYPHAEKGPQVVWRGRDPTLPVALDTNYDASDLAPETLSVASPSNWYTRKHWPAEAWH